jgi:hypothetical protein
MRVPGGEIKVLFHWKNLGSKQTIEITKSGTYDGAPLNWPEWERKG